MTNQISKVFNAYETTLTTAMTTTATSMVVVAAGSVVPLTYLCIDPDDPTSREYVLVGAVVGTTFSSLTRYLAGSAFGSGITHNIGAIVRSVPLQQMWEDLHDRVTNNSNHANLSGLTGTGGHSDLIARQVVDAKGDLIVGSGADAVARFPAPADDSVLMADSGQGTGWKGAAPATPGPSAVGDSATAGTTDTFSRGDHRHSREGFGAPGASAPGDVANEGAAATVARSDHRHAREALAGGLGATLLVTGGNQARATSEPIVWGFGDSDFWSGGTPNRATIPAGGGGLYLLIAHVGQPGSFVGKSGFLSLLKNGTVGLASGARIALDIATFSHWNSISWVEQLVAGDFIQVEVVHDIGSSAFCVTLDSSLTLVRIGS